MARQAKMFADEAISELDDAAEAYQKIKERRMKLALDEHEKKGALLALMKSHKKKTYSTEANGGLEVELVPGEDKIKVRRPKDEAAE